MADVFCIVNQTILLSEPTRKIQLQAPLAYTNAQAHAMQVTVFNDDGSPADLSGVTVVGNFKKGDGNTVSPITGTVSGNVAQVVLPASCYLTPGRFTFTLDLGKTGGFDRTALWVDGMVEKNIDGTIIDPGTPVSNITQAINDALGAAEDATEAAEAANDAAEAATEAVESIGPISERTFLNKRSVSVAKTQTGNPLEIEDALPQTTDKVVVGLQPQQDLHGYDKPWVGGSGKNRLPTSINNLKAINTSGSWSGNVYTISDVVFTVLADSDGNISGVKANGTATANAFFYLHTGALSSFLTNGNSYIVSGCPDGGATGTNGTYELQLRIGTTSYADDVGAGATVSFDSSSDNSSSMVRIVVYNGKSISDKVFYPMIRLSTVTDSTYEPYSNICPITGYDSVEVVRTGKNLLWDEGHKWHTDGAYASQSNARCTSLLKVDPGQKISFSKKMALTGTSANMVCRQFDENKTFIRTSAWMTYSVLSGTYTIPSDVHYIGVSQFFNDGMDSADEKNTYEVQVEFGSAPTAYEAPSGITYSISLTSEGTVYGGTVTINEDGSGTLVVDKGYTTVSSLSWTYISTSGVERFITSGIASSVKKPSSNSITANIISDSYKALSQSTAINTNGSIAVYTDGDLLIKDTRYSSADTFKNAMANCQIVYELATTQSYPLTASQITTLLGYNRIYTNGDTLDVTYRTDKYATKDEAFAAFATDTASGAVASFSDGADDIPMKKLTAAINPVQDLHGYDKPWPAGGGKNKLPMTVDLIKAANASFTWDDNVGTKNGVAFTIQTDNAGNVTGIKVNTSSSASGNTYFNVHANITFAVKDYTLNGMVDGSSAFDQYMYDNTAGQNGNTDTGSGASFTPIDGHEYRCVIYVSNGATVSNKVIKPMLRLASVSDATYEPYTNICPISGWDEANVTRCGKNLLNTDAIGDVATASGTRQGLEFTEPGTYTLKNNAVFSESFAFFSTIRTGDVSGSAQQIAIGTLGSVYQYTITEGQTLVIHGGSGVNKNAVIGYIETAKVQLELGSTATSYEPYTAKTLSVNLKSATGSTVYGGTLTINSDGSGTVVVDRAKVTLTGNEQIAYSSTTNSFYHEVGDTVPGIAAKAYTSAFDGVSDRFSPYDGVTAWASLNTAVVGYLNDTSARLRFCIPGETSVTDSVKAKLAGTEVAYRLATPITYTLTATQLRTLLGSNNVWADTGNVSVVYRADPEELFDNVDDLNRYINSPLKRLFPEDLIAAQLDYASLWDGEHTFKLQLTIMRVTTPGGARYGARMEWVADT